MLLGHPKQGGVGVGVTEDLSCSGRLCLLINSHRSGKVGLRVSTWAPPLAAAHSSRAWEQRGARGQHLSGESEEGWVPALTGRWGQAHLCVVAQWPLY